MIDLIDLTSKFKGGVLVELIDNFPSTNMHQELQGKYIHIFTFHRIETRETFVIYNCRKIANLNTHVKFVANLQQCWKSFHLAFFSCILFAGWLCLA
jgi:hypothetical protein